MSECADCEIIASTDQRDAVQVTGFTIKWLEITDSFKATVAMANLEVELVVANAGLCALVPPDACTEPVVTADIARAFSRIQDVQW